MCKSVPDCVKNASALGRLRLTSRNALVQWERGDATPNAGVLALMSSTGVDVLYVVTGQRSGESEATLARAERALLQGWRDSDEKGRAALAAVADVVKPAG